METKQITSNDYAFPTLEENGSYTQYGLTKREYFAAMAMQGILTSRELQTALLADISIDKDRFPNINHQNCWAIHAVDMADELLKQLEQTNE